MIGLTDSLNTMYKFIPSKLALMSVLFITDPARMFLSDDSLHFNDK